MTTPNRIVFEKVLRLDELPDSTDAMVIHVGGVPYRRIDAPADSRLLEVAIGIYQRNEVSIALEDELRAKLVARCVVDARALIAACEGAAQ